MNEVPLWLRMHQPLDAPIRAREEQERIEAEKAEQRLEEFFQSEEGKQALKEIWEGLSHEH